MAGLGWTVIYGELFFNGLTYNEGDAWHPSASDHNKAATSSFILQVKEGWFVAMFPERLSLLSLSSQLRTPTKRCSGCFYQKRLEI